MACFSDTWITLRSLSTSLSSRCSSFSSVAAGRDPDRSFRIAVVT
jgi:hypothetical protein